MIMGTWNYRIIDHGKWLGLHEVFYDIGGNPRSYAVEPEIATDKENGVSDIIGSVKLMLRDAQKEQPILNTTDFKPTMVEPEVFYADLMAKCNELAVDKSLAPYRAIAEKCAADMKSKMDDDVIGHLGDSHIVFGTACIYEAMQDLGRAS